MRGRMVIGIATALSAVTAGVGLGAPTWVGAVDAGPFGTETQRRPAIASDAAGNVVVAWPRSGNVIRVATRTPGAAQFDSPVDLTPGAFGTGQLQLAVDGAGTVTAMWAQNASPVTSVARAAVRPAGAVGFSSPVDISPPGAGIFAPQLSVNARGDVVASWIRDPGNPTAQVAVKPAGAAAFGPVEDVSAAGLASSVSVALDGAGTATVGYVQTVGGFSLAHIRTRPVGAVAFGPAVTMSPPGVSVSSLRIAGDEAGTTTAVWSVQDGATVVAKSSTRTSPAGAFSAPATISAPGVNVVEPRVASDPQGTVTAAWIRNAGSINVVQAATRPAGATTFGTPADLSAADGNAQQPSIHTGSAGRALVAWWMPVSDGAAQLAVRSTASEPFAAATTAGPGTFPVGAFDAAGHVYAAWEQFTSPNERIRSAVLDGVGPAASASVPATAERARPVTLSATATDTWSPATTFSWTFADGTASGASISHAFSNAGPTTVTIVATDGAGNATTLVRQITVVDTVRPVLSKLSVLPPRVRTGRFATLRVTASEPVALTVLVQRPLPGRRVGTSCRVPAPGNAARPRCVRFATIRTIRAGNASGTKIVRFAAKSAGRNLPRGTYRLAVTARDRSGNVATRNLVLTVVR